MTTTNKENILQNRLHYQALCLRVWSAEYANTPVHLGNRQKVMCVHRRSTNSQLTNDQEVKRDPGRVIQMYACEHSNFFMDVKYFAEEQVQCLHIH